MPVSDLLSGLSENQIFGAGAGLVGVGVALAGAKKGLQIGTILFRRKCMISLEVNSRDTAYDWLLKWINARASRATQHLSVQTSFTQGESGNVRAQFSLVPSPGDHFIVYKGRLIKIERQREKQMQMLDRNAMTPFETVVFTTFGTDPGFYTRTILQEAKDMALEQMESGTIVYQSMGPEWRQFGHPRRKRPLSSVVLDSGISERIYGDVKEFVSNTHWYANRGVPYRRGYLLYGPPGCGKSSFVRVTFSGLLNALDGVASSEGRLLFMTTNHIQRLDSALIRPGRVDLKEYIGYCTETQLREMFMKFYPDSELSGNLVEDFVGELLREPGRELSAAEIQGLFLRFKNQPEEAVKNARDVLF